MKKLFILILSIFSSINICFGEFYSVNPPETAIFELPDHSEWKWKEITHYVSKEEGTIEMIPLHQTVFDWTDLICIQFIDTSSKSISSLDDVIARFHQTVLANHPKDIVTWQIIERTDESITFEWVVREPNKKCPSQHEISRSFLTPFGFHRIGFTRRNGEMDPEERAKWIELLNENTSIVFFQDARNMAGFSLVEKLQDSVFLGDLFQDWIKIKSITYETGNSFVLHIPPTEIGKPLILEDLEVRITYNTIGFSLSQFHEFEKSAIQENVYKKTRFRVIEQKPNEIVYFYTHPTDNSLLLNVVTRTFFTDYGCYSISRKKALKGEMKKKEIMTWIDNLKTIEVKAPSRSTKVFL